MSNGINTALVTWAWEAMWNPSKPYYLPTILINGLKSKNITIDPVGNLQIAKLDFPDLVNKDPWGSIGVELTDNTLSGVNSMHADPDPASSFTYDEKTGDFTAKIAFSQITLSGDYDAQTGGVLGCAVDVAAIAGKIVDPFSAAAATNASDVAPLDSARNYRTQLLQSDNGTLMVQSYYENNETYAEIFGDPAHVKFQQYWAQVTTAGKTTKDYGLQTNNAVQPGNAGTVPINGQPDAEGNSPYNAHSFLMQNFLIGYCYKAAAYYQKQGLTEKATRFNKGGTDAGTFGNTVKPSSAKSMTANSVMGTVATAPPPTSDSVFTGLDDARAANQPKWLRAVHDRADTLAEEAAQHLATAPPKTRLGDTGIPITGSYSDTIATTALTLSGIITFSGEDASVKFSSIQGDLGKIQIELSKPTGVNSDLFTAIAQAIANTDWVTGTLASAVKTQLNSKQLLDALNQVMQTAIAKALG